MFCISRRNQTGDQWATCTKWRQQPAAMQLARWQCRLLETVSRSIRRRCRRLVTRRRERTPKAAAVYTWNLDKLHHAKLPTTRPLVLDSPSLTRPPLAGTVQVFSSVRAQSLINLQPKYHQKWFRRHHTHAPKRYAACLPLIQLKVTGCSPLLGATWTCGELYESENVIFSVDWNNAMWVI